MEYDDVLTRNSDGELAVRTVSATEQSTVVNPNDVYTRDTDGNLCIRTTGSGGDSHNKGYYATLADLQEAYPTGEAGDYAIIGATDTVWVWDTDTNAWVDTDTKGEVTSVNNQTGDVSLDINDVAPTQTDKSGYVLGTDGFVAGWVKPEIVQRSVLPQASEEEVGNIYQYVGTTDANYTNGYFYKCVSDGQNPATYSWENIEVQEADALPDQTGKNGKFLTTNGTTASWADVDSLPSQTGNAGKFLQTDGTDASWQNATQMTQPSTMPTLAVADWVLDSDTNKYRQTVNVTGVTADNVVYVSSFPANADEYAQCGVLGVAQGVGTLTFQCDTVPQNALGVNVVIFS